MLVRELSDLELAEFPVWLDSERSDCELIVLSEPEEALENDRVLEDSLFELLLEPLESETLETEDPDWLEIESVESVLAVLAVSLTVEMLELLELVARVEPEELDCEIEETLEAVTEEELEALEPVLIELWLE